ncbi:MAG: hypothetical protein IT454_22570 [Planctomycetes bacterium]|nr:hypothetical protein [Planctomycetota bacterium]
MMLALWVALCVCQEPPGRFALAELELSGPLRRVRVELDERAATEVDVQLAAGERRLVSVPLAAAHHGLEPRVIELPEMDGGARWNGWSREGWTELSEFWAELPLALRHRPAVEPAVLDAGARVPPAALLAASAVVIVVLAARRRALLALAVSIAGSVGLFAVLASGAGDSSALRILEGDGASGRWIAVDVAWERWSGSASTPLLLESAPPDAAVLARASLADPSHWSLFAARSVWRRFEVLDPAARRIDRSGNLWGACDAVWTRDSDGGWRFHGPWEVGEPLAPGLSQMPPGRFNPALPQGVEVVLARLAPGAFCGTPPATQRAGSGALQAAPSEVWLRWVGRSAEIPGADGQLGR